MERTWSTRATGTRSLDDTSIARPPRVALSGATLAVAVVAVALASGCSSASKAKRGELAPTAPAEGMKAEEDMVPEAPSMAGASKRRAAMRPLGKQCARPFLDVPAQACSMQNLATYGSSPATPAEWGSGAGRGTLWYGRLMCPSGAMPRSVRRVGSVGRATRKSSSPLDPASSMSLDVVDLWEVSCPNGTTVKVYHNLYRCGSPCPPPSLRLLPGAAYRSLALSHRADRQREYRVALKHAEDALRAGGDFEILLLWSGRVHARLDLYAEALALFTRAERINRTNPATRIHKAAMLVKLNRNTEALAQLDGLKDELPAAHPKQNYLMCLRATALMSTKPDEAKTLARSACKAGEKKCC